MNPSWYQNGLRFHCFRCGRCCSGPEGYVWVTEADIARIAAHRGETAESFAQNHVRRVEDRLSLLEKRNDTCEMFDDSGCAIYPVRPAQCRSWPFWPVNIASPAAWRDVGAKCPGVGAGEKTPVEIIEAHLRSAGEAGV